MTRLALPFDPSFHAGRVTVLGVILGLLALLVLPTGCRPVDGRAEPPAAVAAATAEVPPSEASVVEPIATSGSLHDLAGRWRDQDGRERTLAGTAAPARVVAMVYASCEHTCPLLVADMKRLEAALAPARRDGVRFVLVTLDPERDTPERLREFAGNVGLDPARWTLLTGSDDDVLELAAALGVRYRRQADGEVAHSNLLTVLDRDGAVTHQSMGVGAGATALRTAVERLLP
jgi:protein SCO1/2